MENAGDQDSAIRRNAAAIQETKPVMIPLNIRICYRFVGYLEVPVPDDVLLALDMRRGERV